jgi:PAS domain S-box-containing protein
MPADNMTLTEAAVGDHEARRILLVEDNDMNRDMLSRRLSRKGYSVAVAVDGAQGIEMAVRTHPDLILMDMSLPGIDGWEAVRQIKANDDACGIPIIALTAHAMSNDRSRAIRAGCDEYDTKPIEFSRLLLKMEALLRRPSSESDDLRTSPTPDPQPHPLPAGPKTSPAPVTCATLPLLVVDDNESNRDVLSRRLKRAGYRVETAESAAEALAILERTPVDLLLLDIMMPGISGIEFLRMLRKTHSTSELPIIMVSALSETKDVVEALNLGANDYVTKPVDMDVALARIDTQLRRKRSEEELAESRARLSLAMRGTNDGMWDWDLRSGEVHYSPRWKALLGLDEEEVGVSPEEWMRRVHRDDIADLRQLLAVIQAPGEAADFTSEHRLLHRDGSWRWMLCRAVVQRTADGQAIRMAGCITDVNQSKARDPLTGLPNRLAFHDHVQDVLERYRAGKCDGFAVYFIDLDRFKLINDSLGHAAGDQLLIQTAQRLEAVIRSGAVRSGAVRAGRDAGPLRRADALARLGGDEFALIAENIESPEHARSLGTRLLHEIARVSAVEGRELFTTASIGIVVGSTEYTGAQQLIRDADTAMYRAKACGKNRCEIFDAAMHEEAMFRLEMVNDLQRALTCNELEVYYQPKVDVDSRKISGFEALLRWHHPTRGLISPSLFIPVAEETGLIVPIGLWVLEEACRTTHRWHREFPTMPPLDISVNLSVRQLRQPDVVDKIEDILRRTDIARSALQLEVTESLYIDDPDGTRKTLAKLKALGVGLKVDDFGTGYSALRKLADMPFDSLKIDRSFIENLCLEGSGENMVRTIIAMAKTLGIDVIAEGVETEGQFDKLASMGCNRVQGFLFSAAVTVEEAESILQNPDDVLYR